MTDPNCTFCNPKAKDWEENGFYGYRCKPCQAATAFIIRSEHKGKLNDNEKTIVEKLCKKHYPELKIKWLSEKRTTMTHWYDFLVPK